MLGLIVASAATLAQAQPARYPNRNDRDRGGLRRRRLDRHGRRARSRRNSRSGSASRSWCSTGRAAAAPSAPRWRCAPRPTATRSMSATPPRWWWCRRVSKSVKYSIDDFEPIAVTGLVPLVLIGLEERPRRQPAGADRGDCAPLRASSPIGGGVGSPPHVMGAWINRLNKLDVVHVPYRGGAQAVADVIGGHIDMFYGGARGRARRRSTPARSSRSR